MGERGKTGRGVFQLEASSSWAGAGLTSNRDDVSKYTSRTDKGKRRECLLQTVTSSCSRLQTSSEQVCKPDYVCLSSGALICSVIGLTASQS